MIKVIKAYILIDSYDATMQLITLHENTPHIIVLIFTHKIGFAV